MKRETKGLLKLQEVQLDDGTGLVTCKLWQEQAKVGMTAGTDVEIANVKVKLYNMLLECQSTSLTKVTVRYNINYYEIYVIYMTILHCL